MDSAIFKRNDTPKSFKNPLEDDFSIEHRDDDNSVVQYIIPAKKISTYPTYLANFFIKHIVDKLMGNGSYITPEEREKLQEQTDPSVE